MIYDFHGNFSGIYPVKKDSLKNPDRDQWGYYWDFEDYLIENEKGLGLTIQGFMITSPSDLDVFSGFFQRAFRMSTINAKIKNFVIINYEDFIISDEFERKYLKEAVEVLSTEIDEKIEKMSGLFESIKSGIRRSERVWIPLNSYWTDLMKEETCKFWGDDTQVIRLPEEYTPINNKELWEELDCLGPIKFEKDMMWEDFSYQWPNLVKYIDPETVKRIDTDFLRISDEYGLI